MLRVSSLTALVVLLAALAAGPADAAVTRYTAGGTQIELRSDEAGDTMMLACEGGWAITEGVKLLPCTDVETLWVNGHGGNDTINLANIDAASFPKLRRIELDGGSGTDTIIGTQLADKIVGDSLDFISGNGGGDVIEGGAQVSGGDGNDTIISPSGPADGGAGDDTFVSIGSGPVNGGPGNDALEWDLGNLPATEGIGFGVADDGISIRIGELSETVAVSSVERVSLKLFDGGQTVDGSRFSGRLEVDGRGGDDLIVGGSGENFLTGGPGNDAITGGPTFDWVDGGPGNDRLLLRDGVTDRGLCGEGNDTVVADAVDSLRDCETVELPAAAASSSGPGGARGAGKAPETMGLKGPKQVALGAAASFRFGSDQAGATFKCRLDKAAYKSCASPFKLKAGKRVGLGRHVLSVYAVKGGLADPTPAKLAFKVVPPKR